MSLFGKNDTTVQDEVLEKVRDANTRLARIEGQLKGTKEELNLSTDIVRLKRELTNLEIEKDRQSEQHEREKRDVKHMVGLEKKRSEFEIDSAKRDTMLTLREENLKADRDRFEQEMKFTRERFEGEVGYLKELMVEVLDRLPKVDVSQKLSIVNGPQKDEVEH